ncbi:ATP-binding protein [Desulfothermus sp.]
MKIEIFRGAPFVDREEEIEFFLEWFDDVPQRLLLVYGPKSSGKTTVIEYVIDNRLLPEKEWWLKGKYCVKYINLRRKLISNYATFLHSFIFPEDVYKETVETDGKFSLKFFSLQRKVLQEIEKKERDLFEELMRKIEEESKNKRCILIIDEIQKLQEIHINSNRELLKEFLNFCVSLTKEKHLSHVVILTSNTVFIEKIYNDAKLKETSRFKKIDHLSKEKVQEWLDIEGLAKKEFKLIWEFYGGNIGRILEAIKIKKKGKDLKEFLERERWLAYTEIVDYLTEFDKEDRKIFLRVARKIVEDGYYPVEMISKEEKKLLQKWAEKEILFYDPLELKVTGNSRIYEKGMEMLLSR